MVDGIDLLLLPVVTELAVGVACGGGHFTTKGHLCLDSGGFVNCSELCRTGCGGVPSGRVLESAGGVGGLDGSGGERA